LVARDCFFYNGGVGFCLCDREIFFCFTFDGIEGGTKWNEAGASGLGKGFGGVLFGSWREGGWWREVSREKTGAGGLREGVRGICGGGVYSGRFCAHPRGHHPPPPP